MYKRHVKLEYYTGINACLKNYFYLCSLKNSLIEI